jgi:hypothetical protein
MLKKRKIPYDEILGDKDAPVEIFDKLFEI